MCTRIACSACPRTCRSSPSPWTLQRGSRPALHELQALRFDGLVTLERARMLTGELHALELPEALHDTTKLTVYLGRHERTGGRPAYRPWSTSCTTAGSPGPRCCSAS